MSTSSPPKRKPLGSSQVDSLTDESVPAAASDAMVWSYDWSRVSRRTWAQSYKSERLFLRGKRSQFTRCYNYYICIYLPQFAPPEVVESGFYFFYRFFLNFSKSDFVSSKRPVSSAARLGTRNMKILRCKPQMKVLAA